MSRTTTAIFGAILLSSVPAAARGQDGPGVLDFGAYRGLQVSYPDWVETSIFPQFAVCYNSVDNEYFIVAQTREADDSANIIAHRVNAVTGEMIGGTVLIDRGADGAGGGVSHQCSSPTVAHCPTTNRYMVCYRVFSFTFAKVLDRTGTPIDTGEGWYGGPRIMLNEQNSTGGWTTGWWNPIEIAADASGFMVAFSDWADVWDEEGGLWARRYDANGKSTGPKFRISSAADGCAISVLPGPSPRYLIAYSSPCYLDAYWLDVPAQGAILCTMLTVAGVRIAIGPEQVLAPPSPDRHLWPRIAADTRREEWRVVWEESDTDFWSGYGLTDVFGGVEQAPATGRIASRRVNGSGQPLGNPIVLEGGGIGFAPNIAWSDIDGLFILHWQRGGIQAADIVGAKIKGGVDSVLRSGIPVSNDAADEYTPFLAARTGSSEILSVWGSGTRLKGRIVDAVSAPDLPSDLAQFQIDGATPIADGFTRGTGAVIRATLRDAEDDALRLKVELRDVAADPSATPLAFTSSAPIKSGSAASLDVTGLALGVTYRWRACTVNSFNRASAWVSFSSDPAFTARANRDPVVLSAGQFRSDGRSLAVGGSLFSDESVVFRAALDDADGDRLQFQVEVQPIGRPFRGAATAAAGTPELSLRLPPGPYHWRIRATDPFGGDSGWMPTDGNEAFPADFNVISAGSEGPGSCLQSGLGRIGLWLAAAGLAPALVRRRPRKPQYQVPQEGER